MLVPPPTALPSLRSARQGTRYAYCENNPLGGTDPEGLDDVGVIGHVPGGGNHRHGPIIGPLVPGLLPPDKPLIGGDNGIHLNPWPWDPKPPFGPPLTLFPDPMPISKIIGTIDIKHPVLVPIQPWKPERPKSGGAPSGLPGWLYPITDWGGRYIGGNPPWLPAIPGDPGGGLVVHPGGKSGGVSVVVGGGRIAIGNGHVGISVGNGNIGIGANGRF